MTSSDWFDIGVFSLFVATWTVSHGFKKWKIICELLSDSVKKQDIKCYFKICLFLNSLGYEIDEPVSQGPEKDEVWRAKPGKQTRAF